LTLDLHSGTDLAAGKLPESVKYRGDALGCLVQVVAWRFIHNFGGAIASARSEAAIAVTPRFPRISSFNRALVQPSLSKRCLRDSFGFKELPGQDLAWMKRILGLLCHDLSLSATINYLYVECVSEGPSKNYSPLIIDPEAS
jgi:hypothetical protein